jgi:hypothetical protein
MSQAKAKCTGLGIENEGKELPKDQLPAFEESKIKIFPVVSIIFSSTYLLQTSKGFLTLKTALEEPSHPRTPP